MFVVVTTCIQHYTLVLTSLEIQEKNRSHKNWKRIYKIIVIHESFHYLWRISKGICKLFKLRKFNKVAGNKNQYV